MHVIDEFDDAWAAGFSDLASEGSLRVPDIAEIRASPHALPAELATKAMHGEEWRMGAYRYAVVCTSGDTLTLIDSVAVWLPDSLTTAEIVNVIPNPDETYPDGDPIPRPRNCFVSTPQTTGIDHQRYEQHFAESLRRYSGVNRRIVLDAAAAYAAEFPLAERALAYAAMWDRLTTGVSRHERFMGDDIELLVRFADREGHCNVPPDHVEGGRLLDVHGALMALAMGRLTEPERRRVTSLPGWETAASEARAKVIGFDLFLKTMEARAADPGTS